MTERRIDAVLAGKHLPGLDGLRAVAVGIVMIYHARKRGILPTTGLSGHFHGDLGVILFFVLSGFLITHLLIREYQQSGTISLRGFYVRRVLRIWPAYFVFLVVAYNVLNFPSNPWPLEAVVSAAAFYHNYYVAGDWVARNSSLTHTWSLSVEEQFYLLWPVLCLWLFARGHRAAGRWTVALIGGVLIWRSVGYLVLGLPSIYAQFALDTRFDSLAIGALLAIACTSPRFRLWAARSARWAWAPLLVILAIDWVNDLPEAIVFSVGFTVLPVLMALLIVQLMQLSSHWAWSWLEHPVTKYLGRISYPLYLYHEMGEHISRRLREAGMSIWGPRQFLVAAVASVLIASVSYILVERPFLALKDRLSSAPEDRPALRRAA